VGPNIQQPMLASYIGSLFQSSVRINVGPNVIRHGIQSYEGKVSILRED